MDGAGPPGEGIGARVRRKEDARHLAGRGQFVGDIRIAGMQDVAFHRSPLAHARIVARRKPPGDVFFLDDLVGVKPMITRSSIPGYKLSEWPAMASDRVRFVGEIIAMCVAPSRARAEDLAEQVDVEFDELPAITTKMLSVATNKPPFAPYRGVARPGVCFAIEQTIDAIARAVGREAADVRALNLVPAAAMPYVNITKKHYDTGDYPASLAQVRDMIGLDAFRAGARRDALGRYLGISFATYTEQSAHGTKVFAAWGLPLVPGYDQAHVKLTPDGALEVKAGIHTIGQGLETTLAQIAHQMTSVPFADIRVTLGDTATTPFSTGAYASRGIVMAGGAVSRASEVVAARIKTIAAHLMQTNPASVTFAGGRIHAGASSIGFADVGHAWYGRPDQLPDGVDRAGLEATEGYKPATDNGVFSFASHAAKVAVDAETGLVEILDYCIAEDCGRMVNPMIVEGQTYGGAAQGVGTAVFEESPYDANGQPLASTLADYLLPGPAELPRFRISHTETLSPHTAHGIKGVGEGGAIAPAGAIVNAINDALAPLGAQLHDIPASPERILAALAKARAA